MRTGLLSIIVGIVGGLGAVVFRILIDWANLVLVRYPIGLFGDSVIRTLLSPTIGGIIVGSMIYFIAKEAKGHGVPEIIYSVNKEGGRMRYRVPFVKILASAITIGSGGSAGREGPIAQIGGGFASLIGQLFSLSQDERKILVISGVSAGIAATFNAPLGGILFGIEIIRRDRQSFSPHPLVISSVVGTTIGEFYLGKNPAFIFPTYIQTFSVINIPFYILLGILAAIVSVIWVRGFYKIEDLLEKIPISPILLAGFGGFLVGAIEIWFPEVSGTTYAPIDDAFGLKFGLEMVIILIITKFLATSFSIGSGGSGGVFAPTLFMGVMFGTAYGIFLNNLNLTSQVIEIYAMLGMAALFAGSSRAPLAAIIMTSEMVNDYQLIIPLMFAVGASWLVSRAMMIEDIYVLKLIRRGVVFHENVDILEETTAEEIMVIDPIAVSPKDRIETVIKLMKLSGHTGYPVVDNGKLVGIITEHDVDKALDQIDIKEWSVAEVSCKKVICCKADTPLSEVLIKMMDRKINRMPIVDNKDPTKLVGWLTRSDIMQIYRDKKRHEKALKYEEMVFNYIEELNTDENKD